MFQWIKTLFVKKAVAEIEKKLDLKEGPMEQGKPWYKSKGVLSGIVTVLLGTYEVAKVSLAPQLGWNFPEIPPIVFTLLGALGIYSRITADKIVGK